MVFTIISLLLQGNWVWLPVFNKCYIFFLNKHSSFPRNPKIFKITYNIDSMIFNNYIQPDSELGSRAAVHGSRKESDANEWLNWRLNWLSRSDLWSSLNAKLWRCRRKKEWFSFYKKLIWSLLHVKAWGFNKYLFMILKKQLEGSQVYPINKPLKINLTF